jgi:hypothetical protein
LPLLLLLRQTSWTAGKLLLLPSLYRHIANHLLLLLLLLGLLLRLSQQAGPRYYQRA